MELTALMRDPRVRVRRAGPPDPEGRCVVYWMQRAQRAEDNPALDIAVHAANALGLPVVVFFALVPDIPRANLRHYRFMMEGLAELPARLARRRVGFVLRRHPDHSVAAFASAVRAAVVVGDENPLRELEAWRVRVTAELRVPFWTVDADVVVPSGLLLKEQFAARTIRPRLHKLLPRFLVREPDVWARVAWQQPRRLATLDAGSAALAELAIDRSVAPVCAFTGGAAAAHRRVQELLRHRLGHYSVRRNRPELDGTSQLSPYLHFGQIGPRRLAIAVRDAEADGADREAFLEQLIVRRELAVSFVRFNPAYDSLAGCEPWARKTLAAHASDQRALVSAARLEAGESPDPLWNAAQRQMLELGWMHNYLRMYWAKRLLEWCASPEEAFALAVALNDRYELDGRDPNGYAGIAWAIGGKHDRAWGPARPIFGTIRYMSPRATARKLDSGAYMARFGGNPVPGARS